MRWNSPAVNSIHAACVSMNLAAGYLQVRAGHPRTAWISWIGAGAIVTVNIIGAIRQRERELRREARNAHFIAQLSGRLQMTQEQINAATASALANLKQVAKATGAKIDSTGSSAEIDIGGYHFHTIHRHICRTDKNGDQVSTCLNYGGSAVVPCAEQIAATLLLLKNDPTIFDRWKRQDNYYA